ncbi:conserved Plasmodium protein, unknown function [Plasmodium chabaudi chabaudi]|uniref:FAD-binding domain-containing protein n=1 Tax=Plasmodium chabaudi chabaudi TaxID=31271 RepID=A0A4V0K5Z3_PLACU|nr:conserved Plasmodium protein, unknown function [Plasmodium chabaudi chabaudi]VTZ67553.1 conserved Plasmodium protein, unknown function [Plasmodium chabaudi chabaudi]|eukprot:XP_016655241.1 conserved Plasmodium protein, unknown function [Plasmodium chabaudi chabaudi]
MGNNDSDNGNYSSNFYTNIERRKYKINKKMETDVLIVGATTGGLILSLDLFRKNIKHIIIDSCESNIKNKKINEQYLLYPRTLEMLHDLNLLPEILANSLKLTGINFYIQNKLINQSSKNFFQSINGNMPYMLSINKMSLNKILLKKIKLNGSIIWYNTLLSPIQNQTPKFISYNNYSDQNEHTEKLSTNNKSDFHHENIKVKKLYTLPSLLKNREIKNALIKNDNKMENNIETQSTSKSVSNEKDNSIDMNLITSNSNSIFSNLSNKNVSSDFSFYCSTDTNYSHPYDISDKTYNSDPSFLGKYSSEENNKYKIEGYIEKKYSNNNGNSDLNMFYEKKDNKNIQKNCNITGTTVRVKHNYTYWDGEKNHLKNLRINKNEKEKKNKKKKYYSYIKSKFIVGVDGKHSLVRKLFNIKMEEKQNNDIEYISADICAKWSNEMHYYNLSLFQSEYGFITCFPIFFDIANVDENNFYSTDPKFKDTIKNMKKELYIRKNHSYYSNSKKNSNKSIKNESFKMSNPQKLSIHTLSSSPIRTTAGSNNKGIQKIRNNIAFVKRYVQSETGKKDDIAHDKSLQRKDVEENKQSLYMPNQKRNRFNKSHTNEIMEREVYKKKELFKTNKPKSVCQKINDYHEKQNNILTNKGMINISLEKKKTKEYFMNFIKKYEEKFACYIKNGKENSEEKVTKENGEEKVTKENGEEKVTKENGEEKVTKEGNEERVENSLGTLEMCLSQNRGEIKNEENYHKSNTSSIFTTKESDQELAKHFLQKGQTASVSTTENDTSSILIKNKNKNKNKETSPNESLKEDTDNNYVDALSNNSMNEINNRASKYAKLGIYNWHITICRKIDKFSQNKFLYPIKKSKEIKYIEVIKLINKIFPNTELYYLYNLKIGIHKDKICRNYYNNYVVLAGEANCFYNPLFNVSVNLTIHDIYNIGWKLKYIINYGCTLILLEGYEKERKYISEKVVSWNREKLNFVFINNNGNNNICAYYNIFFLKFFAYIFQKFPTNYNIFEKIYLSTFLLQHNYTNYVINNTRNVFFCNKNNNIYADRAKNCILKFISSFNKSKENKNVSLYDYLKNQMHTLILCINITKEEKPICNYITTQLLKNKYNKKLSYTYDKPALKKLIKIARLTHNIMGKKGTQNNNTNCREQPFLKILWILCNQNKSDFIQTNTSICSANFNVYTRNFTTSSYNIPNELINTIKDSKIKDQVILYDFINDFQKQYNINFYLPNNLIYQPNFQSAIYIFIQPDFHITHINYVNDDNQIASFLDHVYNFYG